MNVQSHLVVFHVKATFASLDIISKNGFRLLLQNAVKSGLHEADKCTVCYTEIGFLGVLTVADRIPAFEAIQTATQAVGLEEVCEIAWHDPREMICRYYSGPNDGTFDRHIDSMLAVLARMLKEADAQL